MRLGLIAGGGTLPKYVAIAARESGAPITTLTLEPFAQAADYKNAKALHIGQLGKAFKTFKQAGCTHVCMAGIVKRPDFSQIKPDLKAMFQSGHRDDALKACEIAREIGRLDIGQAAVVALGLTLAVEAQEGTDEMLARVLELPEHLRGTEHERCGVLAKLIKPAQDTRVDLPTIGPETVRRVAKAGLAGIVAEAGQAFILERDEVINLADAAGIFIVGIPAVDEDASQENLQND